MKILNPPIQARNLTAWFVMDDERAAQNYITLEEAVEASEAAVHETGDVNQLLIENLGPRDVFIHVGDLVKGGRQDRTIGVDFIVPSKSGRLPVPVFCVEQARWHRRGAESGAVFSKPNNLVSSKLRAKMSASKSQGVVWSHVAEEQTKLSCSAGIEAQDQVSPSSLMLSYQKREMADALAAYEAALEKALPAEATGVVWAVNGRLDHADLYGSADLLAKVWIKLRLAAATEALAASNDAGAETAPLTMAEKDIVAWLEAKAADAEERRENLPPRTSVRTRSSRTRFEFETTDSASGFTVHRSLVEAAGLQG
jgi:hypothetical protein